MYHGEVTIEQEGLKDFMDIGKDLGIKGLIHEEATNLRKMKISEDETFGHVIDLNTSLSPVSLQKYTETKDRYDILQDEVTELKVDEKTISISISDVEPCDLSIPESETNTTSVKYEVVCQTCNATFQYKKSLVNHIKTKHEGFRYSCSQCEYQCKYKSSIRRHQLSKHEGVRYFCNMCDYKATEQGKYIHEGVTFPCNQCDHQAKHKGELKRHIQVKHECLKFFCNICDFQTGWKNHLTKHSQIEHSL